jgi:hypothetical protein
MQSPLVLQNTFFTLTQLIVLLIAIAFQVNVTLRLKSYFFPEGKWLVAMCRKSTKGAT